MTEKEFLKSFKDYNFQIISERDKTNLLLVNHKGYFLFNLEKEILLGPFEDLWTTRSDRSNYVVVSNKKRVFLVLDNFMTVELPIKHKSPLGISNITKKKGYIYLSFVWSEINQKNFMFAKKNHVFFVLENWL